MSLKLKQDLLVHGYIRKEFVDLVPLDIFDMIQAYCNTKQFIIDSLEWKLGQRSSVYEIRMRGIVYDHPSVRKGLTLRKRYLLRLRATRKIEAFLQSRHSPL